MAAVSCPHCGAEVQAGARFCSACGHELVVVGDQRRVATVLFADLVGFTSLSESLDPEQVKGLVDRCFERLARDIEAFGGHVDKVLGDAIVALFGAPVAHEDDAERAVRAGLRMQETIAGLTAEVGQAVQMRVGINTGEVLVGAVRAGREYTAMGDVVNTANRLQAAAEPGTVLVGPDTRAVTRDAFEYVAIDPVQAKGKRLPVEAWVAVRPVAPPGQRLRRSRAPMVGREAELALLAGVTATAIERSRAALLVVHGEAGMGKSRLATEAAEHAGDDLGALVLEGRCVPYGEANVWWPVAEAIRSAAGLTATSTPEETDRALRKAASDALRDSGRIDELDRTVAGLHHLLGHDGSLRGIDASRAREEAIRSVVALAEGFTQRRPVFVVLSDLHWADQEVLDLVDTLLARVARRPFVLLGTARRALSERWTPAPVAANSIVLHLDPLDDEASHRLLRHLSDGSMHPSMAAMLVERAGGNPFYLEELVSLVSDAGVRTVEGLLAADAGELPSTLRGLVAARLDALSPADRQLLDDAAVLGRRNRIDALVTMAAVKRDVDPETARAQLESLAAREFLVFDGELYTFRSEVIREVAYSTLTKADRARSHAGIARWIEEYGDFERERLVDQVANHWAAAAELVAEIGAVTLVPADVAARAIEWLYRATLRAEADVHPATVESLTTRALALMDDEHPKRAEVLRLRARSRTDRYELDAALADVAEAEALARDLGDDRLLGDVLLVHADALHHRGSFPEAHAVLAEAKQRFADAGHRPGCAEAERLRGMVHLFGGDFSAADEALREALSLFEQVGDTRGEAWALQNLSWSAYIAGRIDEAEQRVSAAMERFEELGDPGGLTWSRGLLAWVRFHQGRNEEALELATIVGEDARERGEHWGEAMMRVLSASISLWSGRTDDAVTSARQAVVLFEEIDDHIGELQARCSLGRALLMAGEVDAGVAELRDALAGDGAHPYSDEQAWMARINMLTSSVQLGDIELGHQALEGAEGIVSDDTVGLGDRIAALGLHHLQRGDHATAQRVLVRRAEARGYLHSAQALISAASGDPEGAFAAADEVARHPHTYLDRAYAGFARALALACTGRLLEARGVAADVIAEVDATGDRLAQAVARLVDAHLAERAGDGDASSARTVAEAHLERLGIDADGWRHLLRDALGAVAAS
jgi:class 3 adenylate cyclase/tetratricopeptide (TPR) repeat protein